jgi:ribosomal protein S18 acetylase RimI-like enzyme
MAIRPLRLPGDLPPLADMLAETFQYPENPEWSVQADEQEDIARELRGVRRMWPVIRMAQRVSPPLRDLFRGFVWEEEGRIGAVVIAQRRGATSMWTIGAVGVLPEFRRRGLARKLLTRTLEDIHERGATHVVLAVIDKNVPAYSLYRSLGFEHYSSQIEYNIAPEDVCSTAPSIPDRYAQRKLGRFEWRVRYNLARRITPDAIVAYEPVTQARYRPSLPERAIVPLLARLQRRVDRRIAISSNGTVVSHGGYRTTRTQKGTSSVRIVLDPAHPELARPLMGKLLADVASLSPTLRIQFSAPTWLSPLCRAAVDLGFRKRLEYHWLGLKFES